MSSLNLSQNGPSITSSYQKVVNSTPTGPASASPSYGIWALYSVKAPLANAFQNESGKESVLSVQTTGEGELIDLIEEFSDGRIQFAYVKVKDPNTTLPKNVLIAWCGEGVPERTKGYFTSHLNAVSKVLHGYHVQVTARSDRDLTPAVIVQKVADASGAKYSGGGNLPASSAPGPPPVASKPILPTKSFGAAGGFQALGARTRAAPAPGAQTDEDGWGQDAPPVSRSQLEKVAPAYQPTKVNIAQLQSQREPSKYQPPARPANSSADVVSGGYQPIGKVDIAAIRKQASEAAPLQDDRPTVVKGAYQPIGKVDIAEIRRKAQAAPPVSQAPPPSQPTGDDDDRPKSLADRSAAFTQAERITELPKPKIANKFGTTASNFAGTKPPAPASFGSPSTVPPVATASRTFADEGGKTPAQVWAEKKARERGLSGAADTQPPGFGGAAPAVTSQPSGGWQSSYGGKKWNVQLPSRTGGSGVADESVGQEEPTQTDEEPNNEPVGSIRDRFSAVPPPLDNASKPTGGVRAVPMPGLPQRSQEPAVPAVEHQDLPPPPSRPIPQDEEEEEEEAEDPYPQGSPARIALPVGRGAEPIEKAEPLPPRAVPSSYGSLVDDNKDVEPEPQVQDHDVARATAAAAAESTFGAAADTRGAGSSGGREAIAQYDYTKDEDNEIDMHEGERITNIEMVDDDWWMGQNSKGERGLFPSNYVELAAEDETPSVAIHHPEPTHEAEPPAGPPQPHGGAAPTATAEYDYEAAEDNELSFPDGATITNVEFPDDDWWSGTYNGKTGLFPANYVKLNE